MSDAPGEIEPDTKDWTWVLAEPCPECAFDASAYAVADLPGSIETNAVGWQRVLEGEGVTRRPGPGVWSATEYACHVRDVHRLFGERVGLMLEQDDPRFANWDQDVTAVEQRYDLQEPAAVSTALVSAAADVAARYAAVEGGQWQRPGRRSNGSAFTVETLGLYHLHDVVHHLWDVGFDAGAVTRVSYDDSAEEYRQGTEGLAEAVQPVVDRFASLVPPGARVLEVGSGGGRDARALTAAGLSVRCTDISPGFVDLLRADGLAADVVDPMAGDLTDPERGGAPYDGVWASASLLHVDRSALRRVLSRLAEVTRPGGALHLSVKEGDGERWSTHGHVSAPRRFVFWREEGLRRALALAGWRVETVEHSAGSTTGDLWLDVSATREEPTR